MVLKDPPDFIQAETPKISPSAMIINTFWNRCGLVSTGGAASVQSPSSGSFLSTSQSSIECGDVTFVRDARQGEQMRYS